MTKIYKIKYTNEVLEKLLNKRMENGDYDGVLSLGYYYIDKFNYNSRFLYEIMAKANYKIEEYAKAINFWFLYLTKAEENLSVVAYNGLGACFYKMGNKELAGFYFDKQLKFRQNRPYEYNDVLTEFFEDVTNVKDKYYLAYPFNKANFDNLLSKVVNYIRAGHYEKALTELEIIPSDSKYYVDALIQKSLCKYLIGKTDEALKDITLAVELDGDNTVALFNAISMFYASGKIAESKKMLEILVNSKDYNDIENAEKVAMIFCELKDYLMAEKFLDTALKEFPNKLNLLILNGITKYNLGKYNDALEIFSKCFRLSNSYVLNYYVKTAKNAINKEKKGVKIPPLDYTFDVQKKEYKRIQSRFDKYLCEENIKKRSYKELSNLFDYAYEKCDMKLLTKMVSLLNKMDGKYSIYFAIKYLLKVDMLDNIKKSLIALIVYKGYDSNLSFVYGNTYHTLEILQPEFLENSGILREAYSVCVSKLAGLENDIMPIKLAIDKISIAIENGLDASVFDDVFSLSAVIFEISHIKKISSRRAFLDYFKANQRTVKKYKELFYEYEFKDDEEFDNFLKELAKMENNSF